MTALTILATRSPAKVAGGRNCGRELQKAQESWSFCGMKEVVAVRVLHVCLHVRSEEPAEFTLVG